MPACTCLRTGRAVSKHAPNALPSASSSHQLQAHLGSEPGGVTVRQGDHLVDGQHLQNYQLSDPAQHQQGISGAVMSNNASKAGRAPDN